MAKKTIEMRHVARDEHLRCVRCKIPRKREDWGKVVTTDEYPILDTPRTTRVKMTCRECIIAALPSPRCGT